MKQLSRMYNPPHPGTVMREFLPDGVTITLAAQRMGVSRIMLSRILNGHSSVTTDMAVRFGMLTQTTPKSWLTQQAEYDLWQASLHKLPKIEPILRIAA